MHYFSSLGFVPEIAMNPSEFLLDIATGHVKDISIPETLQGSTDLQEIEGMGELIGAAILSVKRAGLMASLVLMLVLLTGGYYVQGFSRSVRWFLVGSVPNLISDHSRWNLGFDDILVAVISRIEVLGEMRGLRSKCKVVVLVLLFVWVAITGLYELLKPVPSGCIMTYMYPMYVPIPTPANVSSDKYGLFLYHEGWKKIDFDEHLKKINGVPVLFIPGNGGSYKQASLFHLLPLSLFKVYNFHFL
ncbi:hypothetical protein GW17_00004241 [Ensete ventricosum]|nr:hypothetical protein GW17_00004241 [Ensete ventricosum]